jgi:uncharacterized lipoprotein YehR (DUF1307 family)
MKKAYMFFVLAILAAIMTACGSEETRTFEMEEAGTKSTITYTYSGDEVSKQTAENIVNYEELGIEKADAEEIIKPVAEQYKDIDGVEYSVEYGDEEAVENIEINYEELDYEKAQKTEGIMLQGDPEKGISMEKSAEMIEEQGYTEVEE